METDSLLTTVTHAAMATEFAVILAASDAHLVEAALEALEMLDEIEAKLTLYQEDSEVSRINARATHEPVALSPETFTLIADSLRWSRRTDGAFDVTAGPLVRAWGFTERRGQKPTQPQVDAALARVGYQNVELRDHDQSVRLAKSDMEINLGAIGKGFALDQLAERLCQRGLANFLIHGGGSSVLARGDQSPTQKGWAVGVSHPTKANVRLAGIRLHEEALSTSGSGKQFFHHRGRRYGHVIDPRTGYPAGDLLSLTAVSPRATDAEACSTAYFVLGSEAISEAAEREDDLPRMIGVRSVGRQDEVEVVPFAEFDWQDAPESIGEG